MEKHKKLPYKKFEFYINQMKFRAGIKPAPTILLDVIRDFKSLTTLEYTKGVREEYAMRIV